MRIVECNVFTEVGQFVFGIEVNPCEWPVHDNDRLKTWIRSESESRISSLHTIEWWYSWMSLRDLLQEVLLGDVLPAEYSHSEIGPAWFPRRLQVKVVLPEIQSLENQVENVTWKFKSLHVRSQNDCSWQGVKPQMRIHFISTHAGRTEEVTQRLLLWKS